MVETTADMMAPDSHDMMAPDSHNAMPLEWHEQEVPDMARLAHLSYSLAQRDATCQQELMEQWLMVGQAWSAMAAQHGLPTQLQHRIEDFVLAGTLLLSAFTEARESPMPAAFINEALALQGVMNRVYMFDTSKTDEEKADEELTHGEKADGMKADGEKKAVNATCLLAVKADPPEKINEEEKPMKEQASSSASTIASGVGGATQVDEDDSLDEESLFSPKKRVRRNRMPTKTCPLKRFTK